jgi:hypothetical protein
VGEYGLQLKASIFGAKLGSSFNDDLSWIRIVARSHSATDLSGFLSISKNGLFVLNEKLTAKSDFLSQRFRKPLRATVVALDQK